MRLVGEVFVHGWPCRRAMPLSSKLVSRAAGGTGAGGCVAGIVGADAAAIGCSGIAYTMLAFASGMP